MARDHARFKTTLSGDEDWNDLSVGAQHLYYTIVPHPTLNYCGVADWRPARLSRAALEWSVEDVEEAAAELSRGLYVVVDEASEEILVRSFIRNDEILKQPNIAVAMTKAYAAVASRMLRGVIVHELRRLRVDSPDLAAWGAKSSAEPLAELLARRPIDPSTIPPFNPYGNPKPNPSGNPSDDPSGRGSHPSSSSSSLPPTPQGVPPCVDPTSQDDASPQAAQQTRIVEARSKRGTRIPDDFAITDHLREWAVKGAPGIDLEDETARFKRHFEAKSGKDATKLDWNKTWMNWMTSDLTKNRAKNRRPASEGFHNNVSLAQRLHDQEAAEANQLALGESA